MKLQEVLECAIESGAFKENRPLIDRKYWVFPCEEDLQAFAALITAADRTGRAGCRQCPNGHGARQKSDVL
jgi:hypothetical protein